MLDTLITSKTRLKLLLKFFLNPESDGYLRSLESEFGESTNGIRIELNRFEAAKMLTSTLIGNKKVYRANTSHPLFGQLQNIVHSYIGLDQIVDTIVQNLGKLDAVYLVGNFARGVDSPCIELLVVGNVDEIYLRRVLRKSASLISKKIIYNLFSNDQFTHYKLIPANTLLLWKEKKVSNNREGKK